MTSQFADMTLSLNYFDVVLFLLSILLLLLVQVSCQHQQWSWYRGFTRNPEFGDTPVWVLLDIWRLGEGRNTKFGSDIFNKMLLSAVKCNGYSFYRFWVIKEKKQNVGGKITAQPRLDYPLYCSFMQAWHWF